MTGAVRGAALLGLGLVAATLWPTSAEPGGRLVRVEGEVERPGWYEGDDLAAAVRAAGGSAQPVREAREGDVVRVEAGWAYPPLHLPPVTSRELGRDPRVSLNRASLAELEALPRVGPVLAARIVSARPFRRVTDLDRVKGVGPATFGLLAPLVRP